MKNQTPKKLRDGNPGKEKTMEQRYLNLKMKMKKKQEEELGNVIGTMIFKEYMLKDMLE